MSLLDGTSSNETVPDLEASYALPTDEISKILEPILCLLAACRGIRSDPALEALNVPDDKFIAYTGEAGVRIFNKTSRFNRIMAMIGRLSDNWAALTIPVFNVSYQIIKYLRRDKNESNDSHFFLNVQLSIVIAALIWTVCFAAKKYTIKQVAASTPPKFDPSSYQCRLVQAMDRRGLHYREVTTNSWEEMGSVWKKDFNMEERFCIEGLKDPGSSGVYDINVKLWNNGVVAVGFAPKEGNADQRSSRLIVQAISNA